MFVTKPMKYKDLAVLLREAGFVSRQGKGSHEVWRHAKATVTIVQSREVSPKVTKDALKAIERSKQA